MQLTPPIFFFAYINLKKALRDTLTRAAWLGPSNFLLVRSEHAHASYPGLFFRPARVQPLYGAGRKGSSGTGLDVSLVHAKFVTSFSFRRGKGGGGGGGRGLPTV